MFSVGFRIEGERGSLLFGCVEEEKESGGGDSPPSLALAKEREGERADRGIKMLRVSLGYMTSRVYLLFLTRV